MSRVAVRAARLVGAPVAGPVTVVAEQGVITEIRPGHAAVDCQVVGDGSDIVTAGLIDVHTHGAVRVQAIDGDVDGLRHLGAFYASHGVTSYLATIGGSDASIVTGLDGVRTLIEHPGAPLGARCLGVHLEGPFISSCCPGAFDPASIVAPDVATFERYVERSGGTMRHVTLAPEVDGQEEVIKSARRMGITCSAGHSAATEAELLAAVELGVRAVTHMFNAMAPMHHREPGIVGVALTDDRIVAELIADGVHVHPRVVALLATAKSPGAVALISDSIAATGLPDGDYHFEEQDITVRSGEARLIDGTLAGSTLTLDRAVANFAGFADIGWEQAVVSATATPARLLGIDDRTGTIAVGYDADLVGFSEDHEVRWTMVGGHLVAGA